MPPIDIILNASGGTFIAGETERVVAGLFEARGIEITIHVAESGAEVETRAKNLVSSDAGLIVVGGGDGTVRSVAAEVYKAGKTLGVLPLGTLNHFSQDLGIPQDLEGAVGVIAEDHSKTIDIGEVNGTPFLNNSSIGLYPRIVRYREIQQERLGRGKWSAAFFAALRVFRINPFFKIRFGLGEHEFVRKTPFVFVGNNEYAMDLYNIGSRLRLDEGVLSVYFLHHGGRWGVIRLLLRTAFGLLRHTKEFETMQTDELTISMGKKAILVALDGEVTTMQNPLVYRILPKALRVLVPGPGI